MKNVSVYFLSFGFLLHGIEFFVVFVRYVSHALSDYLCLLRKWWTWLLKEVSFLLYLNIYKPLL